MDIKKVTKVDIGTGNAPVEGFTSLDLYNDLADIKADMLDMPFDDGQIEEINMSHVLEHINYNQTVEALQESRRVLKEGGKLFIEVPNFEAILIDWVNSDEAGRWGHRRERIFGQQQHAGDHHNAGFTKDRLRFRLEEAGFTQINVDIVDNVEHHEFVLRATAIK